jgi:hypothetical protein
MDKIVAIQAEDRVEVNQTAPLELGTLTYESFTRVP